jgi:hypothetical protein
MEAAGLDVNAVIELVFSVHRRDGGEETEREC